MSEENKKRKIITGVLVALSAYAATVSLAWVSDKVSTRNVNRKIHDVEYETDRNYKLKADLNFKAIDSMGIREEFQGACERYIKKDMKREMNGDVVFTFRLPHNRCRVPNAPKYGE